MSYWVGGGRGRGGRRGTRRKRREIRPARAARWRGLRGAHSADIISSYFSSDIPSKFVFTNETVISLQGAFFQNICSNCLIVT